MLDFNQEAVKVCLTIHCWLSPQYKKSRRLCTECESIEEKGLRKKRWRRGYSVNSRGMWCYRCLREN